MIAAITVVKLHINTFTNKKRGGFKYFRAFNTALFKQILVQLVLWNKQAPFKSRATMAFLK